ncbi:hypothetical protein IWX50DRAFT_276901 [Phyllosticta citricarpa]|uniref:Uncharacterized protein n=1 Tax=Phyllosticta citricarpa TaxID=55181 RepID=A0ABR1MID9_9PEZI
MPPIASVSRRERTSEQKSLFDILHLQASEQNASITTTPLSPFWQPFGSSLGAPVHHAAKSGQHFSHSPHHRFRQSVYRARRTCLRSLSTHLALAYIARTVPLYLHWVKKTKCLAFHPPAKLTHPRTHANGTAAAAGPRPSGDGHAIQLGLWETKEKSIPGRLLSVLQSHVAAYFAFFLWAGWGSRAGYGGPGLAAAAAAVGVGFGWGEGLQGWLVGWLVGGRSGR